MEASRSNATPPSAPERSLNHQVVLEEDEYTEALSKIIARDFFPSLVHLDATNEYLDAVRSRDPSLITASVRRLESLNTPRIPSQTPSRTPYGTGPVDTPREEPPLKRARYNTDLSLDSFQAQYTSEDNSSFTQILDEENRQRREKWSWAWDAQKRVEAQQGKLIESREKMLIEGPSAAGVREKFRIEAPVPVGLIRDVEYKDEAKEDEEKEEKEQESAKGKELAVISEADVMAPVKDKRTAGVDGWKFKARNSLMFPPDADQSPYHTVLSTTSTDTKIITHSGTRIREESHSGSVSEPPSPTRSRIGAAIMGTPYRPRSEVTVNNFSLVPNLPSPTPSELGPAAVKQLMTWGTLNATPRIISSDDPNLPIGDPSTPFRISEPTGREQLSMRLSNKASKSLRARAGLISQTPGRTPRKGDMGPPRRSEAPGSLTPAAKRLLERTTMGTRRAQAMERTAGWDGDKREKDMNNVRWTPTPNR